MFREADLDNSGEIGLDEFRQVVGSGRLDNVLRSMRSAALGSRKKQKPQLWMCHGAKSSAHHLTRRAPNLNPEWT